MTDHVPARKPGRRPGSADTRGGILTAARAEFAARGYEKATMRAIARAAGVDAALVHHYFGSKEKVFLATMEFPLEPDTVIAAVTAGDRNAIGERVARFALTLWEAPEVRERLLAVLRSVSSNEELAALMREFVRTTLVERLAAELEGEDRQLRVEMAISHIIGLAMARYVIRVEPVASADPEVLVALLGPAVQQYLAP